MTHSYKLLRPDYREVPLEDLPCCFYFFSGRLMYMLQGISAPKRLVLMLAISVIRKKLQAFDVFIATEVRGHEELQADRYNLGQGRSACVRVYPFVSVELQ